MTESQQARLYAHKQYVTDKESFGYEESGARIGETPNIAMDAGTEELARLLAAAPELLAACEQAKNYLQTDLVEPGRSVFWSLVAVIAKATGQAA